MWTQTVFQTEYVGMFMICLLTDFTCLDPSGPLVITIKPKINTHFLQSYVLHSFKMEVTNVVCFFDKI